MEKKLKKITTFSLLLVILIASIALPVSAATNDSIVLKKADKEFLIYYKELCQKEFQFAITTESSAKETELSFTSSVKDQLTEDGVNVAYIDEASYTEIFGENPAEEIAYVWIKDADDKVLVEADKIDLSNALDDEMINIVNTTTIVNEKTDRIEVDTTQIHVTHPVVEDVTTTVKIGKVVVKEKENSNYYYNLVKVSDENALAKEMYELAETIKVSEGTDTYESLVLTKRFYELYEKLIPSDWTEVENSEILQPETARTGDKYIVYLKEVNADGEIVDAKFLESVYEFNEERIDEEDKIITETVKLPVTFDSGIILFTILGIIVLALIVFIVIKKKSNKKDEK